MQKVKTNTNKIIFMRYVYRHLLPIEKCRQKSVSVIDPTEFNASY